MGNQREVFLTFDIEGPPFREDFMNHETLNIFSIILRLLNKYNLKGLFFITGSVAEKIAGCPEILEQLTQHHIGYHSTTHSIKPRIFEYTDVKSYTEAMEESLKRETSRIDPLTGKIVGEGGILLLRKIFPNRKINCFRAPFLCWTPPHLEALNQLGIRFDFSTNFCHTPCLYKGLSFYPHPIQIDSMASTLGLVDTVPNDRFFTNFLPHEMIKKPHTVLMMHPATLAFKPSHYSSDYTNNSLNELLSEPRSNFSIASHLASVELILFQLSMLQKMGAIRVTPPIKEGKKRLNPQEINLNRSYKMSTWAPQHLFGYKPKFLRSHFHRYFELP